MLRIGPGCLVALVLVAGVNGCALHRAERPLGAAGLSCTAPLKPSLRTVLYMDRSNVNVTSGRLTDEEWQRFVDDVLLRYFPAGGTILANTGWWRRPDGSTGGGAGRMLVVLVPAAEAGSHRAAVQAVIAQIKQRYGHRFVLWEEDRVCVAF
ncbi:MAG: DUF3574 domain-containing protein [Acidobacteriota bacterium]